MKQADLAPYSSSAGSVTVGTAQSAWGGVAPRRATGIDPRASQGCSMVGLGRRARRAFLLNGHAGCRRVPPGELLFRGQEGIAVEHGGCLNQPWGWGRRSCRGSCFLGCGRALPTVCRPCSAAAAVAAAAAAAFLGSGRALAVQRDLLLLEIPARSGMQCGQWIGPVQQLQQQLLLPREWAGTCAVQHDLLLLEIPARSGMQHGPRVHRS
eukprot:1136240-Pelagomonas_calceolata.AAC.19